MRVDRELLERIRSAPPWRRGGPRPISPERAFTCPTCGMPPRIGCRTLKGRKPTQYHAARTVAWLREVSA